MSEQCIALIDEIVAHRKTHGMTQADLGRACGLTQSVIARFESKKSVPQLDTLIRILDALGLSLSLTKN